MRGSAFSTPVRIVLLLSNVTARLKLFIPLISSITLALRFRIPTLRLTSPLMRTTPPNPTIIRDSFDIARHIDVCRQPSLPSLFPPAHLHTIRLFATHAQTLNSFMRGIVLVRLREEPSVAESLYLPRWLRGRFFTKFLISISIPLFAHKYVKETAAASRTAVRDALLQVRAALAAFPGRNLRYLCAERLTYADIAVAEAVFFDPERHPRHASVYSDSKLLDEFPDVVAWARAVRSTHFADINPRRLEAKVDAGRG